MGSLLFIITFTCTCFQRLHASSLLIGAHSHETARYDASLNVWQIGVDGTFQADCILPQYSYNHTKKAEYSIFMNCVELTQLVFNSPYVPPTKFHNDSACFSFFSTLSRTSYMESQLLCGDPYSDNIIVWQPGHTSGHIMVKHDLLNVTISFRILFIKRMNLNYAVHVSEFSFTAPKIKKIATVMSSNLIIENYCVKSGLTTVKNGLLEVYNYHETLSSCNVKCGDAFVRSPWAATSLPEISFLTNATNNHTSELINSDVVTCREVRPPFNAVLIAFELIVASQYQIVYTLPDSFFKSVNALASETEEWFQSQYLSAVCAIDVAQTRYSDEKFETIIERLMDGVDTDNIDIIASPTARRLLQDAYSELDATMLLVLSSTHSPKHISDLVNNLNNEVLNRRSDDNIDSVQNVHIKSMYHVTEPTETPVGTSFSRIESDGSTFLFIILFLVVVVIVIAMVMMNNTNKK